MTVGDVVHINATLAQLPGFSYGVPLENDPRIYGYGTPTGHWELFERTDCTDPAARWSATCYQPTTAAQLTVAAARSSTRSRQLPPNAKWASREDALAWLVTQTLTTKGSPP